jgi:glutamate N-acetyltransferase/amino-acid N-acetyltransferase
VDDPGDIGAPGRLEPGGHAGRPESTGGGEDAAEAIRTTDTVIKVAARSAGGITVGGMAKGAAMLAPGLATMLVVVTTDAVMDAATAHTLLADACRTTFERLDSDGCMSTNDTVLLLASGASGITAPPETLAGLLTDTCADLAAQLINDAEGATKSIAITVAGAADESDAVEVGRSIARSNLLKCALFGNDPNWGRVLSAVGTTHAAFDPDDLDVAINGIWVARGGQAGEPRDLVDLTGRDVAIRVELHAGDAEVTIWTNDLTNDYVYENSAYST